LSFKIIHLSEGEGKRKAEGCPYLSAFWI